jgi:hypothetical protein
MTHHKTRKSKSKSRHNKTRGGGKEKKYNRSSTARSFAPGAHKKGPNAKKYSTQITMPKKEWNALTTQQQREAQIHTTVGPNE